MVQDNLLYTKCSHKQNGVPCLNEGMLFCRLCNNYFCDEHACQHTALQVDKDVHGINYAVSADSFGDLTNESNSFFRELSADQLKEAEEIPLRQYMRKLLAEAHRVRRELERRMIENPTYRAAVNARAQKLADDERERLRLKLLEKETPEKRAERELKAAQREQKKQAEIAKLLAIVEQQIKLGNVPQLPRAKKEPK